MPTKLTIIVPVYNVEKYLSKCLDSLINQTFTNLEVISVNDGSTDKSLQILENYANKDNRIKIINQQNQGVSVARNVGIDNATGEYILFVDADDWLEVNACELIIKELKSKSLDLLYFNYCVVTQKYKKKKNIISLCDKHSSSFPFSSSIWASCFNKSFLKENDIYFPAGIKNAEDVLFMLNVHAYHPKYSCIKAYLYNYKTDRELSATKNNALVENDIKIYQLLCQFDFYNNFSREEKLYILDIFSKNIYGCWLSLKSLPDIISKAKLLNNFLENYKNFKDYKYKRLVGYNRIKYKYLIRFLKYFRDFFFLLLIRGKNV